MDHYLSMISDQSGKTGIYIHIPFCAKKCLYCDFYSTTRLELLPQFIEALCAEIRLIKNPLLPVDTIYIGGGTPSLLDPDQMQVLISVLKEQFQPLPDMELTMEVNPGTISADHLNQYQQTGVNRLSIGVQSFQDELLKILGRSHTKKDATMAIFLARQAGFENIGIDLIFGLPTQTAQQWQSDLETAISFSPEHISSYILSYEPGTSMTYSLKTNKITRLSDETVCSFYKHSLLFLKEKGYFQYEVSNFSKSEKTQSRHSRKYWMHKPYIGLGPSAHSFGDNKRSWNVRSVDKYIELVNSGKRPVADCETLNQQELMTEGIYLGLRRTKGINIRMYEDQFQINFYAVFKQAINTYLRDKQIEIVNGYCRLTDKAMPYLDSIAAGFVEEI